MTPDQQRALLSSACMDWETPEDLILQAHAFEPIGLDPATAPDNPTNARAWIAPPNDGLGADWRLIDAGKGHRWINPPYGHGLPQWVEKVVREAPTGEHTTLLIPARTDTAAYRRVIKSADAVVYLDGRLLFRIRCEPCTLQDAAHGGRSPEAVYASRWYKRADKITVYVCDECAQLAAAPGETLKPIARATFPSMLAYWGDDSDRWCRRFGIMGDLRELRMGKMRAPKNQGALLL